MASKCVLWNQRQQPHDRGSPKLVDGKMPNRKVLIAILIAGFLALIDAMPAEDKEQDSYLFGLPFLQFKNGGVRVNFGGYHAEAGLGGLLTGSRTGGGLHASAGTPWGAHAGAGLGGDLGGNDATAGGGLYARAGLGQGRPEAAAGLGGKLDGSGRSAAPVSGGLYAGATPGNNFFSFGDFLAGAGVGAGAGAGAGAGGGAGDAGVSAKRGASAKAGITAGASAGVSAGTSAGTSAGASTEPRRSSIQIISRSQKDKPSVKIARASGAEIPVSKQKEIEQELPVFTPPFVGAEAGLLGAVFANGAVGKVKVKNGEVEEIPSVPLAPRVTVVEKQYTGGDVKIYRRLDHPRLYFKKRFRAAHPRKHVIYLLEEGDEPKTKTVVSVH